jgi:hypothetical protein
MDKQELDHMINKKMSEPSATTNIGITWIDGRILWPNPSSDAQEFYSKSWLGLCNMMSAVWAIAPLDYERITLITTIRVNSQEMYCEKAHTCLHFDCRLNNFKKDIWLDQFKDCGQLTLGIPHDFGKKPFWFNKPEYVDKWKNFVIPIYGGTLRYNEEKAKEIFK